MQYLKYSDISLIPQYSECHTRSDCNTSIELLGRKFELPIIPANMKSVINMDIARWMSKNDYFYIMHRFDSCISDDIGLANSEGWKTISFSVGAKAADKITVLKLSKLDLQIDFLTIDIAHGHCQRMKSMIKHIKKSLPETKIIAGNVATPDAVEDLAEWGADVVKVGIGQGSPCTTKDKTGFTTPMFSCVQACAHFYPLNVPLIADGGIKSNGDIAKALVAGATMVMAGSIFAACSDSPATSSTINDVSHKAYFGSASLENKGHNNHIEGKLTQVVDNNMSYKEKLAEIKQDLQSSISYSGGLGLDSFCNTKYIEV